VKEGSEGRKGVMEGMKGLTTLVPTTAIASVQSPSLGIFQHKMFSSSTKCPAGRNVPVQNIQSVGISQYKMSIR
jgi:hypothetical protein